MTTDRVPASPFSARFAHTNRFRRTAGDDFERDPIEIERTSGMSCVSPSANVSSQQTARRRTSRIAPGCAKFSKREIDSREVRYACPKRKKRKERGEKRRREEIRFLEEGESIEEEARRAFPTERERSVFRRACRAMHHSRREKPTVMDRSINQAERRRARDSIPRSK